MNLTHWRILNDENNSSNFLLLSFGEFTCRFICYPVVRLESRVHKVTVSAFPCYARIHPIHLHGLISGSRSRLIPDVPPHRQDDFHGPAMQHGQWKSPPVWTKREILWLRHGFVTHFDIQVLRLGKGLKPQGFRVSLTKCPQMPAL